MPKLAYDAMLLPGETLAYRIEGAYDISSSNSTIGTLYITSFQLFFVDALDQRTSHIPLGCIGSIKKPKGGHHTHNIPITDKSQYLEIRGKDLRRLKYILPLGACKPAEVRRYLELASSPEHFNDTFAFFYSPNIEALDSGWEIYNPLEEFRRIGLIGNGWRVTEINANFAISKTYPEVLVVPETITDKQLEKVAEFRSKGRIPACVWKHKTNTATISRCSQPMVGLGRVRCEEDEALFREIHRANNGGKALYIVDARPKVNAAACNLSGGGTENVSNYTESRALLEYSGIANIHVVRDALKRLAKACEDQKTKDVGAHWFGHLASILAATRRIVSYIEDEGCSVVTHCTDGWDRTSQLCALSEMLLDPYYRTIKGFLVVICKEFLSFGHKFNTRNGNIANLPRSQRAPIFVQFLDCVWQLTRQFPTSFEFSEHLLLLIATHLHTHVFGTFLGDCELERRDATLRTETASLWGLVLRAPPALAALLTNPMYTPSQSVLRVNANTQSMQLWREYHARWAKKAAENGKANGDKGTVKDNKGKGMGEKGHENGHGGENGKGAENGKDGDDGLHKVDPTLLHETMLVPFLDTLPQADQDNIRKELKEWLSMGGGKPRQSVRMSLSPASLPPLPIEHESPSSYNTVHPQHKKGKEKSLEDVDWDSAEEGRPRAKSLSPTENGKSEPVGKLNGVGKGRDDGEEEKEKNQEKEKEKNQENHQQGTTTTTPTTTTTNEGGTPSTPSGSTLNISPPSGSTLNISKSNGSTLNISSSSGSTLNLAQQNNPNTSTNTPENKENKEHKEEPTNPENPPNNSHDTNVNNNHSDNDNNHNVNSTGAATETSTENSNTS